MTTLRIEIPCDKSVTLMASMDDVVKYFTTVLTRVNIAQLRVVWEVGLYGKEIQKNKRYGDASVESFAQSIGKGKTWVYQCITMFDRYTWEQIQEKFESKEVPSSTVLALAAVENDSTREQVEKLVLGEGLAAANVASAARRMESGDIPPETPTLQDKAREQKLGDDDPNVLARREIRRVFCKLPTLLKKVDDLLAIIPQTLDELSNISDSDIYSSAEDDVRSTREALAESQRMLTDACESIDKCVKTT